MILPTGEVHHDGARAAKNAAPAPSHGRQIAAWRLRFKSAVRKVYATSRLQTKIINSLAYGLPTFS